MKIAVRILIAAALIGAVVFFLKSRNAAGVAKVNNEAVRLIERGEYEKAAGLLEEALRKAPGNASVRKNLATAYEDMGRVEDARIIREGGAPPGP